MDIEYCVICIATLLIGFRNAVPVKHAEGSPDDYNWPPRFDYPREPTDPDIDDEYIIGGTPTGPGKWPWMVSLDFDHPDGNRRIVCGGLLVRANRILSAAHCFDGMPDSIQLYASIGVYNRTARDHVQRIRVIDIITHEEWHRDLYTNDIAMLKLFRNVDTGDEKIGLVALPNQWMSFKRPRTCYIIGWGGHDANNEQLSDVLLERNVSVLSNSECQERWDESRTKPEVHKDNICIDESDGVSTCYGDSGSPLNCFIEVQGQFVVAGLSSWGSAACHTYPSVYTRLTYHLDWIRLYMDN